MMIMKKLMFLILLLINSLAFAEQTLYPIISEKPDISEKAQNEYLMLKAKYDQILNKKQNNPLSDDEIKWLEDNEMQVVNGDPFSTVVELDSESWGDIAYLKQVTSTSHLKSSKSATYVIENTIDKNLRTTWATSTNNGINEEIRFIFNPIDGVKVKYIDIHNGYQKSEKVWKENSRARKIEVLIAEKSAYILILEDTIKKQRFQIEEWPLNSDTNLDIKFKVLEVYPGNKYQDLCISEINFGGSYK